MKQDGKYGRVICARSRQKLSVDKEFFKIKEAKELKINVTNGTIALLLEKEFQENKEREKSIRQGIISLVFVD